MVVRLLIIFLMCIVVRGIKTVQQITQTLGQKTVSAGLIALETLVFVLVFNDILTGELSLYVILSMVLGYVVGYYLGTIIEDHVALGHVKVTIKIAKSKSKDLSCALRSNGFIFLQSKRYYTHKGNLKKLHKGVIFRKELPKLKILLSDFNVIATVENVKEVFGKPLITSQDYLDATTD